MRYFRRTDKTSRGLGKCGGAKFRVSFTYNCQAFQAYVVSVSLTKSVKTSLNLLFERGSRYLSIAKRVAGRFLNPVPKRELCWRRLVPVWSWPHWNDPNVYIVVLQTCQRSMAESCHHINIASSSTRSVFNILKPMQR